MRKILFITSITLLLFTFSSCIKSVILSNKREDYIGENLRIDGFYYQKKSDGTLNNNLYFFYKNGVIFEFRISNDFTDPAECVSDFTKKRIESHRKGRYNWGIFRVNNNEILCEQWSDPIGGYYVHTITQ